jgi:hypothetical protein
MVHGERMGASEASQESLAVDEGAAEVAEGAEGGRSMTARERGVAMAWWLLCPLPRVLSIWPLPSGRSSFKQREERWSRLPSSNPSPRQLLSVSCSTGDGNWSTPSISSQQPSFPLCLAPSLIHAG